MPDRQRTLLRQLLVIWVCVLVAASCRNRRNGPAGRDEDLAIDSIAPSQARPGERVGIVGDGFGSDSAAVLVTFGDSQAVIVSVRSHNVNVVVPSVAPGEVFVAVTVDDEESNSVPFTVIRGFPTLTRLTPEPVRTGDVLFVAGENLAGANVIVTVDSVELNPSAVLDTLLTVPLPISLEPSIYGIRVNRDGEISNRLTSNVEIFTATGTYAVGGTVRINNCPGIPPAGSPITTTASFVDARPTLSVSFPVLGSLPLEAVLEDKGSFEGGEEGETNIRGNFSATPSGDAGFTARLEIIRTTPDCRTVEELTGTRTSP
jgi:hypothetical protein